MVSSLPEPLLGGRHESRDLGLNGNVAALEHGPTAGCLDLGHRARSGRCVDIADHNGRTFPGEEQRCRAPHTVASASDDGDLP